MNRDQVASKAGFHFFLFLVERTGSWKTVTKARTTCEQRINLSSRSLLHRGGYCSVVLATSWQHCSSRDFTQATARGLHAEAAGAAGEHPILWCETHWAQRTGHFFPPLVAVCWIDFRFVVVHCCHPRAKSYLAADSKSWRNVSLIMLIVLYQ